MFWEILRVGVPGSLNTVLTNLNVALLTSLVGPFGTFALAGYGMGARLEYLQIPLVFGFGAALVTMVGTRCWPYGAGAPGGLGGRRTGSGCDGQHRALWRGLPAPVARAV